MARKVANRNTSKFFRFMCELEMKPTSRARSPADGMQNPDMKPASATSQTPAGQYHDLAAFAYGRCKTQATAQPVNVALYVVI